jgi:hypothetical protein
MRILVKGMYPVKFTQVKQGEEDRHQRTTA